MLFRSVIEPREEFLQAMAQSQCKYYPFAVSGKRIRVSGVEDSEKKSQNLQTLVRKLVQKDQSANPPNSLVENIISNLPVRRQKALFIVNSYDQCDIVWKEIQRVNPELAENTMKLTRGINYFEQDGSTLSRTELPGFGSEGATILIVPLQTIERGYNILNDEDKAAFGSIHFLVRPMPHPEDFMINVHKLNGWACQFLTQNTISEPLHVFGLKFRAKANLYWKDLFDGWKYYKRLEVDARNALLTDTFALFLQVIGRTIRGNVPTQVYFHDGAFMIERNDTEYESLLMGLAGLEKNLLVGDAYMPLLKLLYDPFFKLFKEFTEV